MTYRKTWFSYVLWVVYTLLCVLFLVCAGNYICGSCFADGVPAGSLTMRALGLLTLPVAAALYWIIRFISGRIRETYTGRENIYRVMECIIVWALFAIGIFLRASCALEYIQLQNAADGSAQIYIDGLDYYNMAKVTENGFPQAPACGGAHLYVACLSVVLSFLGNKISSAVTFQVFLQIIGLVLAYGVTRKAAGRIAACTVLCCLACSAGYMEMLKNLGPECLFFDLYLLGMLAAVSYVKRFCANGFRTAPALTGALLVGILIGILGYLDAAALTILFVMAAVIIGTKRRPAGEPVCNSSGIGAVVVVTALFSCAAGLCGAWGVASLYDGIGFAEEANAWAALHVWNTRTFGFRLLYPYSPDLFLFAGLTVLASFLVFEFFRGGGDRNYDLWILLCIAAAPTSLAVVGVRPLGLLSMYFWGVLAGLGLQNCIFGGKMKIVQKLIEEINQAAEELEMSETLENTGMPEKTGEIPDEAEEKPRFLENPLPLPKKHVPRLMDYQYEVAEKDMKFDIEIGEEDDFDF